MNTRILTFIAALVLSAQCLSAPFQKEVIYLFGDSLSAPSYSWAEQIDMSGEAQIMNYARNGLHMVDVDIPDWIACKPGADKVIIWLGGNDALNTNEVSDVSVETQFRDMMLFLTGRSCDVYVILPPHGAGSRFPDWEDRLNRKRGVIFGVLWGKFPNAHMLDMPWDWNQTPDGLHQNQYLHSIQAEYMREVLGL